MPVASKKIELYIIRRKQIRIGDIEFVSKEYCSDADRPIFVSWMFETMEHIEQSRTCNVLELITSLVNAHYPGHIIEGAKFNTNFGEPY
jgi:hypothetical protein